MSEDREAYGTEIDRVMRDLAPDLVRYEHECAMNSGPNQRLAVTLPAAEAARYGLKPGDVGRIGHVTVYVSDAT